MVEQGDRARAACAGDRSGPRRRAHVARSRSARTSGSIDEAIAEIREAHPSRAGQRPGPPGAGARATGSARETSRPRSRSSRRAIELNPEAGYSYLQLALLLAWEGSCERAEEISRRAVDLQEQYISGNAGLQIVGAHAPARLRATTCRGRYDDALSEYERELAFIGSSDHALRDRTCIELNVQDRRRLPAPGPRGRCRQRTSTARSRSSTPVSPMAPTIRSPATTSPPPRAARRRRPRARFARARRRSLPALTGRARPPRSTSNRCARDPRLDGSRVRSDPRFPCTPRASRMYDVVIVGAGPAGPERRADSRPMPAFGAGLRQRAAPQRRVARPPWLSHA